MNNARSKLAVIVALSFSGALCGCYGEETEPAPTGSNATSPTASSSETSSSPKSGTISDIMNQRNSAVGKAQQSAQNTANRLEQQSQELADSIGDDE